MQGKIIGMPSVVVVGTSFPKARLAVAVETEHHMVVPALLSHDVYPVVGQTVTLQETPELTDLFDFIVVKK